MILVIDFRSMACAKHSVEYEYFPHLEAYRLDPRGNNITREKIQEDTWALHQPLAMPSDPCHQDNYPAAPPI